MRSKENQMNLGSIRKQYLLHRLREEDTGNEPMNFFMYWLNQAIDAQVPEPTAMVLSTINDEGKPSSRVVLLKECTDNEFRFFTNYESNKGKHLEAMPFASILFFWKELERQVRVEGSVHKLSPEESDTYFKSRPLESRLGAVISPQSSVIPDRAFLEELFAHKKIELMQSESNGEVSIERPSWWGGYALIPESIEFWQGRESRLHDRIRFRLENNKWIKERLAP